MLSYWFVCYVVRYINRDGNFCVIRGNSVHGLPTKSFLPGTVQRIIKNCYIKNLSDKIPENNDIYIVLENFGAIDKDGFDDFNMPGSHGPDTKTDFYLSGREYIHKTTKTKV